MRKFIPIQHLVKNQRGITLVEVLVVLAIFAVLGVSSLLVMGGQLPTMRLNKGQSAIRGEINAARAQAVRHNKNVILVASESARLIQVWFDENDNLIPGDAGDELLRRIVLPDGVQFGYGGQTGAPTSGPDSYTGSAAIEFSNCASCSAGSGIYHIIISSKGWVKNTSTSNNLTGVCIRLSNTVGKFVALEILTGGVVIPWAYNVGGNSLWKQK